MAIFLKEKPEQAMETNQLLWEEGAMLWRRPASLIVPLPLAMAGHSDPSSAGPPVLCRSPAQQPRRLGLFHLAGRV